MTRPPLGARLWHEPSRQWVTVVASTWATEREDEVKVELVNLPGSEMVVKVASLREQL